MPLGKPWRTPTCLGYTKKIRGQRKGSKSERKKTRRREPKSRTVQSEENQRKEKFQAQCSEIR